MMNMWQALIKTPFTPDATDKSHFPVDEYTKKIFFSLSTRFPDKNTTKYNI